MSTMNDDLTKKIALLQLKEKVMKDSGDVLTDLADMQALRQFSAELKELIDEQHAAGAIPANPLAALRERLMKVVDAIKGFKSWQEEQESKLGLGAFLTGKPKVSFNEIEALMHETHNLQLEARDKFTDVTNQCQPGDWLVHETKLRLASEYEQAESVLLPELTIYRDETKFIDLKMRIVHELEQLMKFHDEQSATLLKVDRLAQQGNYKDAKLQALKAKMISEENESLVSFTDIEFEKAARFIRQCSDKIEEINWLTSSNLVADKSRRNEARVFLKQSHFLLEGAEGEYYKDLNKGIAKLRSNLSDTNKERLSKYIIAFAVIGIFFVLLIITGGF
jgi:hypothetical protein